MATTLLRPVLVLDAGYHELTRVQMQAIPTLLAGRELLACAPTGSGKTAAFLIPMLCQIAESRGAQRGARRRKQPVPHEPPPAERLRGVVVVPTQELARQTLRETLKLSRGAKVRACVLTKKLATAAAAMTVRQGVVERMAGSDLRTLTESCARCAGLRSSEVCKAREEEKEREGEARRAIRIFSCHILLAKIAIRS